MQLLANNARAKLQANLLVGATSLTVEAGKADSFPIGTTANWLAPADWFKVTLEDDLGNIEIVRVGTRGAGSGVLSQVLRGQDGTTARAFTAGTTIVEVRYTKEDAEAGLNAILTSLQKAGGTMTGPLLLSADAVDAMNPVTKQQYDIAVAALGAANAANATAAANAATAAANAQTAANAAAMPPGGVAHFMRAAAPAGWIKANGGTIGNPASGGTTRANADTLDLFTLLWTEFTNAQLPIQDSAGVASARLASAALDYAANKRLPVFDLRGEFVRGLDDGRGVDAARVLGSAQADAFKAHNHQIYGPVNTSTAGGSNYDVGGGYSDVTSSTGGAETRPRNVALLACIKL